MDNEKEISFGAFDSELMHQEIFIPEGFEATIDGNKIILKKIESEDERIRKELIEHVKDQQSSFISAPDCRDKYEEEENNKYNSWLSWLEKQGTYTKKDVDDAFVEGMALAKNELEKQGEKKSSDEVLKIRQELYQSGYNDGYKHGCEDTKKQGEQKSTDDDMKEALRTEYEKGRADAFAQIQQEWSEEDEYNSKLISSTINRDQDLSLKTKDKLTSWIKSIKQRIGG